MKADTQLESKKPNEDAAPPRVADTGFQRRFPVGAEPDPAGGTHFRVWAPKSTFVKVELSEGDSDSRPGKWELTAEANGYFSGYLPNARPGMVYRYELSSGLFPDPASRFQPEGPHGPSQIVDGVRFDWSDAQWRGLPPKGHVIYELHIGTFTHSGTWAAAQEQLRELADLGISVLELMPVSEFPGRFGWGYDGVDLFAPTRLYGSPDDFRRFVDAAHRVGLGVILDVVYNHFGPDGNYLHHFAEHYFTDRYKNEWGQAINFDGDQSGPVREFFCANAAYWIEEFHLDGLRLDATQQIFDASAENIHQALVDSVRQAGKGRGTFIVAENETQTGRLVRPISRGGYGLDALWNDDFHHAAMVALTGQADAYYTDYLGTSQELVSLVKHGFLYQGQRSRWQAKRRGTPCLDLLPNQFVNYLQNHDQVANSLFGRRLHELTAPGRLRALTALLLLGPASPMLFQGQEFAASTPFLYFADHKPELSVLVAKGRKEFLSQFTGIAPEPTQALLTDPGAHTTFARCKLNFDDRAKNAEVYQMHRDLLKLRREDAVFAQQSRPDGAVLSEQAFVLRFFGQGGHERLLFVNLGRDQLITPLSEPLLASPSDAEWELIWSSESPQYGGSGMPSVRTEVGWHVPGHSAYVFGCGTPRPTQSPG